MLKLLLTIPYYVFIYPPLLLLRLFFSIFRAILITPIARLTSILTLPIRTVSWHSWRAISFAIQIGGGYRVSFTVFECLGPLLT